MGIEIQSSDGKTFKSRVYCLFYSEFEDPKEAAEDIRKRLSAHRKDDWPLVDRFEGVEKVEKQE